MISRRLFSKPVEDIIHIYKKRVNSETIIDIYQQYQVIKSRQQQLSTLQQQKNQLSKQIAKSIDQPTQKKELTDKASQLSKTIAELDHQLKALNQQFKQSLTLLPNIPDAETPDGLTVHDNRIIKESPLPVPPSFPLKPYWELYDQLNLIDEKKGTALTGNRFAVLNSDCALLERALSNFMLDIHTQIFEYREVGLPLLVNESTMYHSGHFPKFKDQVYTTTSGFSLIPTAESPLISLFADHIFSIESLPVKLVAYTPCFRKEAGTYGKKDRGYFRQHQFNKVELVQLTNPENANQTLEEILSHAESIVQRLKLPYRIIQLCAGELGFSATKGYDIEVWLPGSRQWVEVSSCSNCSDFQARRANMRFQIKKNKKTYYINTLNGSGLAIGRIILAILENFQQADNTVIIPEVIFPYTKRLTKLGSGK